MKRILFIGHSPQAIKAIEAMRANGIAVEITMLSVDGQYPFIASQIPSVLAKTCEGEDLFYRTKQFFKDMDVNLVLDQKISRINVARQRVHTEQKEKFDFDVVVFSALPQLKRPDVRGKQRAGIFGLRDIRDLQTIQTELPLVENVVIHSSTLSGLLAALVLQGRGKDVTLVTPSAHLLPELFNEQAVGSVVEFLQSQGIAVYSQNDIAEFLGETEIKAVRLQSGKVLACDVALLGELPFDLKLLADSELVMQDGIVVDRECQTNLSNVFAVDAIAVPSGGRNLNQDFLPLSFREAEGNRLAMSLAQQLDSNGSLQLSAAVGQTSEEYVFELGGASLAIAGNLLAAEVKSFSGRVADGLRIHKIFLRDGRICGCFVLSGQGIVERILPLVRDNAEWTEELEQVFRIEDAGDARESKDTEPTQQGAGTEEAFVGDEAAQSIESSITQDAG